MLWTPIIPMQIANVCRIPHSMLEPRMLVFPSIAMVPVGMNFVMDYHTVTDFSFPVPYRD
eukprot:SAG31_NODE_1509_length_8062_cov_6.974884_5_plen_60_part_00